MKSKTDCFLYREHEFLEIQHSLMALTNWVSLKMLHRPPVIKLKQQAIHAIIKQTFPVTSTAEV